MTDELDDAVPAQDRFHHQALLYDGAAEYAEALLGFLREGLENDEPMLVVLPPESSALLRDALSALGDTVALLDMARLGRNPGRIIPALRDFLDAHAGRPVRAVGEPIWDGRSPAEIAEVIRHEALVNDAFAGATARFLCPYDVATLPEHVLADAARTHPELLQRGRLRHSPTYTGSAAVRDPVAWPLPDPPPHAAVMRFDGTRLAALRAIARERAYAAGLRRERVHDVLLALNEVTTNTAVHGPGTGIVWMWLDGDTFVCEVADSGQITDPLAGRRLPATAASGGRGLWLANQLCDLVELRSTETGNRIRLHFALR